MKGLSSLELLEGLFTPAAYRDALESVEFWLDVLVKDREKTIHDKVVGDYSFEELLSTLMNARRELREKASMEAEID